MRIRMRVRQLSVRLSMLLVSVVTVFLLIGGAAGAETPPKPTHEYVVRQGDTLWGIAAGQVGPDEDIRGAVEAIKAASGITSSSLQPGQVIRIPQG